MCAVLSDSRHRDNSLVIQAVKMLREVDGMVRAQDLLKRSTAQIDKLVCWVSVYKLRLNK